MAIRLRRVEGVGLVALCAARSVTKAGDVYLDDEVHHALSAKFSLDFASEWGTDSPYADTAESHAINAEESNNPARDWWDSVYGVRA